MMKNLYEDEEFLKLLKKEGHPDGIIEFLKKHNGYSFSNGKWSVGCIAKKIRLNNNGMKLLAMNDEGLTELHFDCENKTVAAVITQSTRSEKAPRKADLSDDPQFFEDLRENIEEILLKGKYNSVTPNEDRTIFKIS